jgi:hypothetical protein
LSGREFKDGAGIAERNRRIEIQADFKKGKRQQPDRGNQQTERAFRGRKHYSKIKQKTGRDYKIIYTRRIRNMVEFQGELSDECKLYMQKECGKIGFLICLISSLIASIIIIIAGAFLDRRLIAFILMPISVVVLAAFPKLSAPMKDLNLRLPKKFIIEDETISIEGEKFSETRLITEVKKVIDTGEWCHFKFNTLPFTPYFVCQKNLIVKGTIEDFEKLFEDKIERGSFQ